MFSSAIKQLPACRDYDGAVRVYARAAHPRSKNWPEGTRPLKDVRSLHYAAIAAGDTVAFRLHRTNVVEWHGPTSMRLNSSYNSQMTTDFANRFLPAGIRFTSYREEGTVIELKDGTKFRRGIHHFELQDGVWRPTSPITKPKRTVLDKDAAALVNTKLKDFLMWIRSIWAVAGNDGSHPWVGEIAHSGSTPRIPMDSITPKNYPAVVKNFLRFNMRWTGNRTEFVYGLSAADKMVKAIREHFYMQENCYIKIDYDAPVPRRTKQPTRKEMT